MGQFRALSQKNWILWKRGICGNIIQVVVPIIFIAFIVAIRKLVTITSYDEQSFIMNPLYTSTIYGQQSTAAAVNGSTFLKSTCPTGTTVGLAPTGNSFVSILNSKLISMGYTTQIFGSDAQITSRIRSFEYGVTYPKFCFGVTIAEATVGGSYKYRLHFNESIQGSTEGPATTLKLIIDDALDLGLLQKTTSSGMMGTTTFLNNLILQQQTGSANDVLKNKIAPIYQEQYQKDDIYTSAKNNVAILFLLPLLIVYLRQTSIMLSEKQKKIRQTMSIMGMILPVYYVTWFIRYFVTLLVIHIIGSAIISATLSHVKFIVPFIVFILFDIVIIIQSFFIQTFFSRAKLGVVIALLFFLIQFIISFISSNSDNPTLSVNTALSIVPHIAFILSFETMFYAQSVKINASFTQTLNNYTISTCVASCIINAIFWLVLTWYLEQVFPNEFGSKKHPLFCCFGKNKVHSEYSVQDQASETSMKPTPADKPDIQEVEQKYKVMQNQKKIINIQNLRKQFNDGDLVAVNNLSLKMYNDNIFVLLGHNGAGKTTTLSMLTGMLEPSSGVIEVLGQTQLQKIRQSIGICPQHDTLYEDLTVRQHLELFGTFRGLTGEELDDQVNKLISDVNLYEKRDQYSKNLSGGQKRRLSVAMAFAGRSKVIILDQPTSGMDTSARRYIWQLLKSYKTDRIILLTTHFMDEADYLGDRIGIMAGGRLICCGSGHYLKNKFGVGYNITFVKKQSKMTSATIVTTVQKYINRAILLSDVSSQITMQLPMDDIKMFPALFNEIDTKKDALGITTYGISITTLEQVFLKVGEQTHNVDEVRRESTHKIQQSPNQSPSPKNNKQIDDALYPVQHQEPRQQLTQNSFLADQKLQRVDGSVPRFFYSSQATILKRLRVIKRDYKSFILQLLLPMVIIILALLLMQISFVIDLPQQQLSLGTYFPLGAPVQIPIGSADATLLNGIESKLNSKYSSVITVSKDTADTNVVDFDKNYLKSIKQNKKSLLGGLYFNGQSTIGSDSVYEYTTIANTKIPTSGLYMQTLAAQTFINHLKNSNITITAYNSPFVRTNDELQINNTISGFFGALIFSIAFGFKFASIISFIVKEREDKSKHQQIVSGMNILAYWFGNFIYDYILYLVLAVFSILMCIALKVDAFTGDSYGVTVCTFLIYGLAYIPLTYVIAYIFKDYGNAQAGYYFFTFVVGGLLSIVVLILRFLGGTANTVGLVLSWIFRFIPSYCFGQILINLGSSNLLSLVQLPKGVKYSPWDMKIGLAPTIYLVVEAFAYTLLVFALEAAFNSQDFMRFWSSESKIQETQQIMDSDVLAMREKALKADPSQYEILTKDLRKVFMLDSDKKYKVAVDNLSVAIEKGEVFGLLGINGAGKTTTFKMLAGQITSTSGDSYFTGMKISQNLKKVRQNLGYCPQFDALIENLTVRQQLQLFYDLKSLPGEFKDDVVSQKIKEMNLEEYQDKLSGTLSGGNKRKLSVAMAMIGNPNIIFLDQPSTGMDPKARRFMWKIISRIASQKKQSTIILTTHSMEQAQALSTKLGIMVNGNFKCIGTPQHIKSKYGEGYEVEIKVVPCSKEQISQYIGKQKLQHKDVIQQKQLEGFLTYLKIDQVTQNQISPKGSGNYIFNQLASAKKIETFQIIEYILLVEKIKIIKQFMESRFGDCSVIESFQTYIRFKVKGVMSVGKMFEILQTQKGKLQIDSYSIKQATVQQIFNRFAEDGQQSQYMG